MADEWDDNADTGVVLTTGDYTSSNGYDAGQSNGYGGQSNGFGGGGGGGGGDNWTCEEGGCGASNYPNRRQCFKCKANKPGGGGGGQFDNPDNWTCEESGCGASNFPNRRQCFKCKANKPGGGGGGFGGGGSQFDNPDNWTCEEGGCGASNFANRRQCFKCKANKPGGDSGFSGTSQFDSPDNWTCPDSGCGASNFANRRQCFKCKSNKPGGGDSGGSEVSKFDSPDNWICDDPECAAKNFPSRRQCFKCQKERVGGPANGVTGDKPREFYIPPEPSNDEDVMFGGGISSGINFGKFDAIPVNVTGTDVPKAIGSFETANLKEFVLTNIKKSGYTVPTPIQKYAIPAIAAKRDLMACAQTGSGKTAAFLIPMIDMLLKEAPDARIGRPHVVIMSPTRELCIQIFNEARKFANQSYLKICIAYGGTASRHQGDQISRGCHILCATPGRLIDFVDKAMVTFEDVKFVVLDEADRMLDMGFMPTVEKMMRHETMSDRKSRQTLMFSATFPEEIQRLAGQFLSNYVFIAIGIVGGACSDVEQKFYEVSKFKKREKLQEILQESKPNAAGTLVFVETKRQADFIASFLSEMQFPTTSIHGDRMQREREEALQDFKTGRMLILVATSVAARGLDIKNVKHVINFDMPKSIDEYVHRIGRTGRVGNSGRASSLFDPEQDSALCGDLKKILTDAGQPVPDFLASASGGSYGGGQGFGGHDVRGGGGAKMIATPAAEPEEEW